MHHRLFMPLAWLLALLAFSAGSASANEEPNKRESPQNHEPAKNLESAKTKVSHGFALYGDLKYDADFQHLDYVNPQAPKGGAITLMGHGTFDSLNPYILKGNSPLNTPGFFLYGVAETNETLLMGTESTNRSGDEPQSAYGLIAQSIEYSESLSWVIFTLRPEARFHDGHPIDADDVLFSYNTLIDKGHPRFKQLMGGVKTVEKLDALRVKVSFKQPGSGADLLRFGELPILPQHYWQSREFEKTTLEPPLLSGPYKVASVDNGRSITFERVTDYWGKDLPVNRGRYNFDRVTFDFYRDLTVAFEAFKGGQLDAYADYTAKNWAEGYDFPAVRDGRVQKQQLPHSLPGNTQALFFNTRKPLFADVRVRQALAELFDYEWTNKTLFYGAYTRTESYFPNSEFASTGLPSQAESDLLKPFRPDLPPELFESEFKVSRTDGSGNIRPQIQTALKLLQEAGWGLKSGKLIHQGTGGRFQFEILFQQKGLERVWQPYIKNLERIGIDATLRLVDATQYKVRLDDFNFDATTIVLSQSLAPSHELREYFHSESASINGSRNYAGIKIPAADALIERIPQAATRQELIHLVRALDRVLLWQHYMVPNWHLDHFRLAWWNKFARPSVQPPFALGFENWWIAPQPKQQ